MYNKQSALLVPTFLSFLDLRNLCTYRLLSKIHNNNLKTYYKSICKYKLYLSLLFQDHYIFDNELKNIEYDFDESIKLLTVIETVFKHLGIDFYISCYNFLTNTWSMWMNNEITPILELILPYNYHIYDDFYDIDGDILFIQLLCSLVYKRKKIFTFLLEKINQWNFSEMVFILLCLEPTRLLEFMGNDFNKIYFVEIDGYYDVFKSVTINLINEVTFETLSKIEKNKSLNVMFIMLETDNEINETIKNINMKKRKRIESVLVRKVLYTNVKECKTNRRKNKTRNNKRNNRRKDKRYNF